MSVNFLGNPKFPILKAELGNVPDYVVMGVMECIWERCHQNKAIKRDGILPAGWGPAHLAALAGWDKDPCDLVRALTNPAINLIESLPDGRYRVHDYADHVPDYVRKRWSREERSGGNVRTAADDVRTTAAEMRPPSPAQPVQSSPSPCSPPRGDNGDVTSDGKGKKRLAGKGPSPDQIEDQAFQDAVNMAVTDSQRAAPREFDPRSEEGRKRIGLVRWMLADIYRRDGAQACMQAAGEWGMYVRSKAKGTDGKVDSVYATASKDFRVRWRLNGEAKRVPA